MTQVFISYSRKDLAFVERLAKDLKDAGLEVWYDLSGLSVGSRWGIEIQNAIRHSQYFIAVLSLNSAKSEWVEREFLYASNRKLKSIPLLYKPCDLPMWCLNLHFIDVRGRFYEINFVSILKALGVTPPVVVKKPESPVVVPTVSESPLTKIGPDTSADKKPDFLKEQPVTNKSVARKSARPLTNTKIRLTPILAVIGVLLLLIFGGWGLSLVANTMERTTISTTTVTHTSVLITTATRTLMPALTNTLGPSLTPVFTPTNTATPGPVSTWVRPSDGMTMVHVPGGNFIMGSNDFADAPVHTVNLDAFWIDKTEVTNDLYGVCVNAGACQPPSSVGSAWDPSYYGNSTFGDYPVIYVKWYDAQNYCAWADARLPTEAEWEKAARGTNGWPYPWGDSNPSSSLLNYNRNNRNTTAVGSYPSGVSPYGALDMAGNVYEWVNDWYDSDYYSISPALDPTGPVNGNYRLLRGGSFYDSGVAIHSAYRGWNDPGGTDQYTGFRCARSEQP